MVEDGKRKRPPTFLEQMNTAFEAFYDAGRRRNAAINGSLPVEQIDDVAVKFAFLIAKETTTSVLRQTASFDRGEFKIHPDIVAVIERLSEIWTPITESDLPTGGPELKRLVTDLVQRLDDFPIPVAINQMDPRGRKFYYTAIDRFHSIKLFLDYRVDS